MNGGPLDGVRVVDLTTVVVGPICTRTLADYGADVIKVEAPGGDLLRTMAQGNRNPGMSGKFINFNRNKRSIVLDLKKPEGLTAMHRLIERTDVFVSNVRPEALGRAGLDYKSLAPKNPKLIHCSILAFGRGGRYYNRPAYDPIVQSLSGVAGTFARAIGEPRFVPMVMSDHTSGLIAAQCIGFALYRREKTGKGEAIDVPMLENMASFVSRTSGHPAGLPSKAAVAAFQAARDRNLETMRTTKEALREHFRKHPALGDIDAYQWYLLVAAHAERHVNQMLEVKASEAFPRK
jgi:crotonobetainyl-CoA:carnitine CoA-transferase CaiB-like acyl-CoA transferase